MSRAPLSIRAVAELGVLVAMATWAVNFTVVKAAVLAWPVLPFSAIRITAAGILVLGWALMRGSNVRMARRDLLAAALFGVIGQGIYQLLWAGAFGTINAGTSALLIAVTPFLTAILASLLRIDPLKPAVAVGGIIAFAGVVAVALGEGAGAFGGETTGVLMTLAAAVCWAVYLLAGARVIPRVGAIAWTAWSMIFGGAALSSPRSPTANSLGLLRHHRPPSSAWSSQRSARAAWPTSCISPQFRSLASRASPASSFWCRSSPSSSPPLCSARPSSRSKRSAARSSSWASGQGAKPVSRSAAACDRLRQARSGIPERPTLSVGGRATNGDEVRIRHWWRHLLPR